MKLPKSFAALMFGLSMSTLAAPDALKAEAGARSDELVNQGYNFTHGLSLEARPDKTVDRFELLVPELKPHTFTLWAASGEGSISARLLGPDGTPRAAFVGTHGEVTVRLDTPIGKYVLELERGPNVGGRALLGVKGSALHRCEARASAQERVASDSKGFHWPYLLLLPAQVTSKHLLVRTNNTGFSTDDLELLRASASCELAGSSALAEKLGSPLLIPLFPRPARAKENLYLHALTREALQTSVPAYRRVDLQLLAMIDDAREVLAARGVTLEPTVLMWGFSASGSFVNRFAVLHPERVLAVAVGSPGGWPLAPVKNSGPDSLPYPVGLDDVEALTGAPVNFAALKRVSWLFFLGDHDENDAVIFRDSFSKADETLILRRFGARPVARWPAAEKLARSAGLDARFKLYPGAAHAVTPAMNADVERFFLEAVAKPR